MLHPRHHRLQDKKDFDRVFSSGCRIREKSIVLIAAPNTLDYPRIGFVVSKKNAQTCVRRNRLRRVIKEQFRLNQKMLSGFDIVFLATQNLLKISTDQLANEIQSQCLECLKRFRPQSTAS